VGACGLGLAAGLFACNAVLGIDEASQEDGGGGDAGSLDAGNLYAVSCDNYCNLMAQVCKPSAAGDNTEYQPGDAGICARICAQFEASGAATVPQDPEPAPSDTLDCRVWHANAARLVDPHVHCPHAGPLGGQSTCNNNGDPCEPFCKLDIAFCTGDAAVYTGYDDCIGACHPDGGYPGFPYHVDVNDPEVTDLASQFQGGSNTLNCRLYHLQNYLRTGDPIHCTHTSQSGGGECTNAPDGG
jgi:hypothetical protein